MEHIVIRHALLPWIRQAILATKVFGPHLDPDAVPWTWSCKSAICSTWNIPPDIFLDDLVHNKILPLYVYNSPISTIDWLD